MFYDLSKNVAKKFKGANQEAKDFGLFILILLLTYSAMQNNLHWLVLPLSILSIAYGLKIANHHARRLNGQSGKQFGHW